MCDLLQNKQKQLRNILDSLILQIKTQFEQNMTKILEVKKLVDEYDKEVEVIRKCEEKETKKKQNIKNKTKEKKTEIQEKQKIKENLEATKQDFKN